MFEGIRYAVIGGVATRMYMPERTTADLDVLVEPESLERAVAQLSARGYELQLRPLAFPDSRLGLIGRRLLQDRPVDVIASTQEWVHDAVETARLEDGVLPIVDLPYLVALKLDASRGVDQGDLTRMLGFASKADLERVRTIVRRLLPPDVDDLEQYIALGKHEVGSDSAPP